MMDRNKDLSFVLLSNPCEERSMQVQTVLDLTYIQSRKKLIVVKKEALMRRERRRSTWKRWLCTRKWQFCCPTKMQAKVSWIEREFYLLFQNESNNGDKRCFRRPTRGYTITENYSKPTVCPLLHGKLAQWFSHISRQ